MKKIYTLILALAISTGLGIFTNRVHSQPQNSAVINKPSAPIAQYTSVNALEIVSNPYKYLNRNIKIKAKFDKFSTLGLDYPPAKRSSEKYISFLIQRPDITNHNIPLSELKIFLKKEVAEKNIDLDAGDEIEFCGKVFSTALGDAWIDVDEFRVINKIKKAGK
ncbi:MAG: hypothetical protein NC191_09330 [Muribaculaceae bacterium]|nr:hypothetical protein [Muribaculaceae bacterium]